MVETKYAGVTSGTVMHSFRLGQRAFLAERRVWLFDIVESETRVRQVGAQLTPTTRIARRGSMGAQISEGGKCDESEVREEGGGGQGGVEELLT